MSGLPDTWLRVALGDVVDYGKSAKADPEEIAADAWVLDLEDIEKDSSRLLHRTRAAETSPKSTKNVFKAGDVLYGKLRPYLNKVLVADEPGYCTTEILPLDAQGLLHQQYLFYWLKSTEFLDYVVAQSHGMNMPRLGTDAGRAAPLVVAPLVEQKRIADKLEAVLGRVDACRDRLDRVGPLLKRFRQSVLQAGASGRLTSNQRAAERWNEPTSVRLGEVLRVSSGKALTAKNMVVGGAVPVYGGNGVNGHHDVGNVQKRTLIVGRVGFYCGSVHMTPDRAWVTDNALIVRHDQRVVDLDYLRIALQAVDLRGDHSSTAQPLVTAQRIYPIAISLPSLDEQLVIVVQVQRLLELADRLEARLAAAQRSANRLTPAVLAKAFRGELVPQDPADEPAQALLDRLRAARASEPPGRRRRQPAGA